MTVSAPYDKANTARRTFAALIQLLCPLGPNRLAHAFYMKTCLDLRFAPPPLTTQLKSLLLC